jgi:hypothetical protein
VLFQDRILLQEAERIIEVEAALGAGYFKEVAALEVQPRIE